MSRFIHIHGICLVYVMYIMIICIVYTCTELIMLTAGLFGNDPSSSIGERDDNYEVAESLFDPDSMWFVLPQLFFHCTLRPIGAVTGSFNRSNEDIQLDLIFFSPFEELRLKAAGVMESKGIHRVYEPSPVPTLYFGRVEDLLGRVPLVPCFLDGNALFHISTAADRRTHLSAAVPMMLAQPHGGAAMFTRSTPGCGTLDGPSLVWATSLWPKLNSSDGSPGLRLPSTDGQLSGLASVHHMVYA
jgi:hypothetical protein